MPASLPATRPWYEAENWAELADARGLDPCAKALVDAYRRDGFLLVEDDRILDGIDADGIWARLAGEFDEHGNGRVQDAWRGDAAVRAIATHERVIALLRMLYGREPIPFQTLNFLNGTEQRTHSDTIHFSSLPSGFMCGVWVALEDVTLRQGPLHYFRGSHRLPEFDYEDLRIPAVFGTPDWANPATRTAYTVYEEKIAAIAAEGGFAREELALRRGSFLIWSANLLHGGSPRDDRSLSRKSQVTHYFFVDTLPITPMFSRRSEHVFNVRRIEDIRTAKTVAMTLDGIPVCLLARDEGRSVIERADSLRAFAHYTIERARHGKEMLRRAVHRVRGA